ncbi:MAG: TerC family protein [Limisphaerales bacterium]|jgi:tellurite resistance protein TerC|nr:TerC family protein [Verrucomicrobiota bacterium]
MPSEVTIGVWHWVGFISGVLLMLALDLGLLHRRSREIHVREAAAWTFLWVSLSMGFAVVLNGWMGSQAAGEFVTGYVVELALSMDNVFVIALIFSYFGVPKHLQHRVLFWGILGAMLMRGGMIWIGVELVTRFHWVLYVLGAFLVFTGIKMLTGSDEEVEPEKNPCIRLARKCFPVHDQFDGQRFLTRVGGALALTPLALVLLMVETTDLVFAVDSIPAIFGVTQNPFVIFTSNIFAILGLRSLYFLLAGAMDYFSYLKYGLSLVLVFIGFKMLISFRYHLNTTLSLGIVAGILLFSVLASLVFKSPSAGQGGKH